MNLNNDRAETWQNLRQDWDLIIIGGGITGAGVFRLAVAQGLRVLLVEKNDFSSGTSSRSTKLIHGGIRYLRNRQVDITREMVR
ncbi:MAG: FAD-dependent oxidoreductase, partial [Chloroflexi bacterium]|nr:FAD-dependent oxidoreductase [Chloroflexota bacterium]